VTLLRRAPREIYRVYSEEEYLSGAVAELGAGTELTSGGERHFHRAAGVTMLVGATGAVGAIVVLNSAWVHTGVGRGPERMMAVAHAKVARSPVVADPPVAPARASVFRASGTTRPLVRRARHWSERSGLHPLIRRSTPPRGSVAIAADHVPVPRSTPVGASAAGAPAEAPPARPQTRPASPEKQPEFGFER
jgi:hypothetical protein